MMGKSDSSVKYFNLLVRLVSRSGCSADRLRWCRMEGFYASWSL